MEEGSLFQRMKQMFQEDEGLKEKPELDQEATELIRNIFRYMDKDARDIMTHRRDIVAIDGEETLEDALKFMLEENHSRFPIYHEDIDEIIGTMHLREAMVCYMNEELRDKPAVDTPDEAGLFRLIRGAFGQRRKAAANSIAAALGMPKAKVTAALEQAGLSPLVRPEQLTLEDFAALQQALLQTP